ncbi:MAG: hypothetical protein JRK53_03870 [Deltaproteobacteria bacterium]|nr:hypothetical protein [Deltaproteobacteria bacterium]
MSSLPSIGFHSNGKAMLIRIVSMLTKLGGREYAVRESWAPYGDYDNDDDNDDSKFKP